MESEQNDDPILMQRRERLMAARKTRASAALVGVILLSGLGCCAISFALQKSDLAILAVMLFGLLGLVLLILEPKARFQRANEFRILRFYRSPRFYGLVITTSAAMILAFVFVMLPPQRVEARQIVWRVRQPQTAPTPAPEVKRPLEFPKLHVEGVVLHGEKSIALINSRSVQLGETIEGVRLIKVDENYIVVELIGQERVYPREMLQRQKL